MGVVHHTHYFVWFEMGRTELLRELGCTYGDMEDQGIFMPVVEAQCRYRAPARYDEQLRVETELEEIAASRVSFRYRLHREGATQPLAEGKTIHATVNREGEVVRLPPAIRDLLSRS